MAGKYPFRLEKDGSLGLSYAEKRKGADEENRIDQRMAVFVAKSSIIVICASKREEKRQKKRVITEGKGSVDSR